MFGRTKSRFEPGEQHQVVRHHGGPDVGLEVVQSAPSAAGGAVGALEAGDRRLDTGAEVAQTTVDPGALDHLGNGDAALLVEGDIGTPAGLGGGEIGAAGVATIGGGLSRRCAGAGNMAIEHRHKALGIGRIAGFDDNIEDQSAFAGRQVELVSVLNLTAAPGFRRGRLLTTMSACGSNRLTNFSLAGTISPSSTRRAGWTITRAISRREMATSAGQRSVPISAASASPLAIACSSSRLASVAAISSR